MVWNSPLGNDTNALTLLYISLGLKGVNLITVYIFSNIIITVFLLLYVDDMLLIGPDLKMINEIKITLNKEFDMKNQNGNNHQVVFFAGNRHHVVTVHTHKISGVWTIVIQRGFETFSVISLIQQLRVSSLIYA